MRVRQTEMLRPLRALHAGQRACQDLSRDFGKRDFQSAPAAAGNDFDWRQSVVLAGASFEAYFELAHKTNAVHIDTSDACITHVDECVFGPGGWQCHATEGPCVTALLLRYALALPHGNATLTGFTSCAPCDLTVVGRS